MEYSRDIENILYNIHLPHISIYAFDTIDHDNLFCILEKYVGIRGNALKLIKSYFSNRTQRVQIDDVLSDFANIICGVPQGSVLRTFKILFVLIANERDFEVS